MRGPCWQFQQGNCQYGASCRFQHVVQPVQHTMNRGNQPQGSEQDVRKIDDLRQWSNTLASTSYASEETWKVRVMSYNVLADALAFEHARELYNKVPRNLLRFGVRVSQMHEEFKQIMPDILSLQEVDRMADLEECLTSLGYDYQYAQRSGDRGDGCAVFWQLSKLRCKASRTIDFAELSLRNNVAQLLILETCSGSNDYQVLVANTHILFNPKRGEIKVAQIRIILEAIHQMCQQHGGNIPCMFMGDLNLTPGSALYEFIASGQLDCSAIDPRNMSGQQESRSHRPAKPRPMRTVQVESYCTTAVEQPAHSYDEPPVQDTNQSVSVESAYDALEAMIAMGRAAANQLQTMSTLHGANSTSSPQNFHFDSMSSTLHGYPQSQQVRQTAVITSGQADIMQTSNMTAYQPTQMPSAAAASSVQEASRQPAAPHQSQQQTKHVPPFTPPGAMLNGLALRVQEDRQPFLPFSQSLRNGVSPSPSPNQPCVDTPPVQMPAMAASRSGIGIGHSSASATRFRPPSSGRRVQDRSGRRSRDKGGMDWSQLATAHTSEVSDPAAAIHHILEHPLQLQSAYMEVTGSEPEFTSCHDKFCGTVDYIWYSQAEGKHVKPVSVLNPPPQHSVSRGLPTALFPSDHVSVVCDFEISSSALY